MQRLIQCFGIQAVSTKQTFVLAKWDVVLDLILGVATSVRFFLYQPECPSNIVTTADLDYTLEIH